MKRRNILGVGIDNGDFKDFVDKIVLMAAERKSSYACLANVHMVVEAIRDPRFRKVLEQADIVAPDGMPLVFSLKKIHKIQQDRVSGVDLMVALLEAAEEQKLSVFLFGDTEFVLTNLVQKIKFEYPKINIAGTFSPPFGVFSAADNDYFRALINSSSANLVFVALGCPKQECWMGMQKKNNIHAAMIGFGGAFSVYAGLRKRAPEWMRNLCLEWIYRLVQEPGRLWRRYLVTNSIFLWFVLRDLCRKRSE